jgi:hypothetical protein
MRNLLLSRLMIVLVLMLECVTVSLAAGPRLVEFSVDLRNRVDLFNFGHAYMDRSLEAQGVAGYEPMGRSEILWADLKSTFTQVSMGLEMPSGRRLTVRGGRGDFRAGEVQDIDFGASGNIWSHTISDASAGNITKGSVTYSLAGASGLYYGISGTNWDLRLDGGRDLMPGTRNQILSGNASTYDARQIEVLLGTRFDYPIGNGRFSLQGDVNGGMGWIQSKARWNLRDLTFTQNGYSLSTEARLGMGIALGASSRLVFDAGAGGTYVPNAAGYDRLANGEIHHGGGIAILASHWTLGAQADIKF